MHWGIPRVLRPSSGAGLAATAKPAVDDWQRVTFCDCVFNAGAILHDEAYCHRFVFRVRRPQGGLMTATEMKEGCGETAVMARRFA